MSLSADQMEHPADRVYFAGLDEAERAEAAAERAAEELYEAIHADRRLPISNSAGVTCYIDRDDLTEQITVRHLDAVRARLAAGDADGALALIDKTLVQATNAVAAEWAPHRVDYLRRAED